MLRCQVENGLRNEQEAEEGEASGLCRRVYRSVLVFNVVNDLVYVVRAEQVEGRDQEIDRHDEHIFLCLTQMILVLLLKA